jgi:hypothetical protein
MCDTLRLLHINKGVPFDPDLVCAGPRVAYSFGLAQAADIFQETHPG